MLNYIWAGLICASFAFALWKDVDDIRNDTYHNGQITFVNVTRHPQSRDKVLVTFDPGAFKSVYGIDAPTKTFDAILTESAKGRELKFAGGQTFPAPISMIQDITGMGDDKQLPAIVTSYEEKDATTARVGIRFNPVLFATMKKITAAGLEAAKGAVTLALGLIGVLALWLGLMRIAETAGLINVVVKVTQPILRPLFPEIPHGHPAMGMVALNLTANMLGLGNAATPFGLKAMEELQKLNKTVDTATNPMVMLLAMNTAGVQIVPPAFLFAVMGLRATELVIPVLISTGLSLVVAIVVTKLIGRLPMYRRNDPDLIATA